MAFLQFPNIQYVRPCDTDTVTAMGYFNLDAGTELKHIMLTIFVRGLIPSAFNARIGIYGNALYESAIFMSEWAEISMSTLAIETAGAQYTQNYLGQIYFDFSGYPLNPNINYYMGIETDGYTRNGDSYYFAFGLDWYSAVNNPLPDPSEAGARVRILGKR